MKYLTLSLILLATACRDSVDYFNDVPDLDAGTDSAIPHCAEQLVPGCPDRRTGSFHCLNIEWVCK